MADLGYVKPAQYGEGLAGLGQIAREVGEAKRAQMGKKALSEAWSSGNADALGKVAVDFPNLAPQIAELSEISRFLQEDRLKNNALTAQMALNIEDPRERNKFLTKQLTSLQASGNDRWEDVNKAVGVQDIAEQEDILKKTIMLAGQFTDYNKSTKGYADRAVFTQRQNPSTGKWEQGFAVYDQNEGKTLFEPIEGEIESPEDKAVRKLKYQGLYEKIKTEEDFNRLINQEKTPKGQFELAKLRYEDETRNLSKETISARSQLGLTALDDLLGGGVAGLDSIYGAADMMIPETGALAAIIRSQDGLSMLVKRDRMINILTLMARKELQGQGQITEGEQAMLQRAVTVLNDNRMRPEDAMTELEAIRPVFERAIRGIDSPEVSGVKGNMSGQVMVYPDGSVVKKGGVEYVKQNGVWVAQ